jgi:hypothetical protein
MPPFLDLSSSKAEVLCQTMNAKGFRISEENGFHTHDISTLVIGMIRHGWSKLRKSPAIVENVLWK